MSLRPAYDLYQYRGHVRTVAPAIEPISASEFRVHINETEGSLPDDQAYNFIAQARELIEYQSGIAFNTQTWKLALDNWPFKRSDQWWDGVRQGHINMLTEGVAPVVLPSYPLQSITSVTTYDEASNSTAVTVASVFDIDTYQKPGRMALKSSQTWPDAARPINAIEIVYVSGYGDKAENVPAGLKMAVKQLAAYLYAHRGDGCDVGNAINASGAMSALSMYKVARV